VQDTVEAIGQIRARRHLVRDPRIADLALCADDALGDRGRGAQERAGDLFSGEAADLAQRERDLCVWRQRRVAAREHQTQPIVLD
jgi:hypothetical protein